MAGGKSLWQIFEGGRKRDLPRRGCFSSFLPFLALASNDPGPFYSSRGGFIFLIEPNFLVAPLGMFLLQELGTIPYGYPYLEDMERLWKEMVKIT